MDQNVAIAPPVHLPTRRALLGGATSLVGIVGATAVAAGCSTTPTVPTASSVGGSGSTIMPATTVAASALPAPVFAQLDAAMQAAVAEARTATYAFGAVLVALKDGQIVARAANGTGGGDPSAHAEVSLLRQAGLAGIDLKQTVMVTTAESCPMCASCAVWAGVSGVVYGTSIDFLIESGWQQIRISQPTVVAEGFVHQPIVGHYRRELTDPLYAGGPPRR